MRKDLLVLFVVFLAFSTGCMKQKKELAALKTDHEALLASATEMRDSINLLISEKQQIGLDYGRLLEQTALTEGVFFEVQIGAFYYFDLSQYNEDFVRLRNDTNGELNKYVLGRFIEYNKAKNFEKDIEKMGIEDAFIVGYVNGVRVEINQAISEAKRMYGF